MGVVRCFSLAARLERNRGEAAAHDADGDDVVFDEQSVAGGCVAGVGGLEEEEECVAGDTADAGGEEGQVDEADAGG